MAPILLALNRAERFHGLHVTMLPFNLCIGVFLFVEISVSVWDDFFVCSSLCSGEFERITMRIFFFVLFPEKVCQPISQHNPSLLTCKIRKSCFCQTLNHYKTQQSMDYGSLNLTARIRVR